jgi:hypothetical protein
VRPVRALLVLLDGIDEAAGMRNEIEMFVHQELAPSNNRIMVTSRPEGVTLPLYTERFVGAVHAAGQPSAIASRAWRGAASG